MLTIGVPTSRRCRNEIQMLDPPKIYLNAGDEERTILKLLTYSVT